MKKKIITLDNLKEYLVVEETTQNNKTYLLALEVLEGKETKEPVIIELLENDEVKLVEDPKLLNLIYAVFITNLITELEAK